jgi:hypothetical protein
MASRFVVSLVTAATAVTIFGAPSSADQTGLASIHVLRREGGRLCMADHFHYGSSGAQRSQGAAQGAAIRSWAEFTDLEYGSDWARYGRAASQRMKCSRSAAGWYCDVEARPCR